MTKAFWVYLFYFRRCWIAPLVQKGGRRGATLIQVAAHFLSRRSMQVDTGARLAHQRVRDTCLYCFYHPCSNTCSPRTATISGFFLCFPKAKMLFLLLFYYLFDGFSYLNFSYSCVEVWSLRLDAIFYSGKKLH